MAKGEESVLVVVRCRPLNGREIEQELEESGGRSKKIEDKHESHTSTPSSTGANAFVGGCCSMLTKMGLVIITKLLNLLFDMSGVRLNQHLISK